MVRPAVGWPRTGGGPFESELKVLTITNILCKMCGLCKLLSYCTLRLWDRSSALVGYGRPYDWSFGSLSRTWDGQSRAAPRRQCYLLMCQETFKETKASHHMFFHSDAGRGMPWSEMERGLRAFFFFKPESELPKSSTPQPCKQGYSVSNSQIQFVYE